MDLYELNGLIDTLKRLFLMWLKKIKDYWLKILTVKGYNKLLALKLIEGLPSLSILRNGVIKYSMNY